MSALDAARLNVRRAGHDVTLLNGLTDLSGTAPERERDTGRHASAAKNCSRNATDPLGFQRQGHYREIRDQACTDPYPSGSNGCERKTCANALLRILSRLLRRDQG